MTNLAPTQSVHPQDAFHQLLAACGIADAHGMEVLRLVHMVANTYENVMAARMHDDKLSAPRWRLLLRLMLEEQRGAPCVHPTQLSKSQHVSKNTISAHLRSLEEQGLIERELDPDDRRQFRIRLSGVGRTLIRNATPGHMAFLNQLTAELTPDEREQLKALLAKLHRSLLAHGQVNEQCSA